MKNIYLFVLFCSAVVKAQIVNIPDANFKAALVGTNCVGQSSSVFNSDADLNNDGEIQLSEALAISHLNVNSRNITTLDGIEAFTNLITLRCDDNNLGGLIVPSLVNLRTLHCGGDNLTTLDVTNLPLLAVLYCEDNLLTEIDLSNNHVLYSNNFSNNLFTSLDFSSLIDDPVNGDASEFLLYDNPNLQYVNFKNGISPTYTIWLYSTPNLRYICGRETHINSIRNSYLFGNRPEVEINSYCSFTPAGLYNTVSGRLPFDGNNNGCDIGDPALSYIRVKKTSGTTVETSFSNQSGNYNFYTGSGSFVIEPQIEIPTYFNVSPSTATVNFPLLDESNQTQNFCISANGLHPDLEIVLIPIESARPGFNAQYKLVYKNKGNQALAGTINLTFDDEHIDFLLSDPTPSNQSPNSLIWNYALLQPFEVRSIMITMHLNAQTDVPPLNSGSILNYTASINYAVGDSTPVDNVFDLHQTVVNSVDPNDKTCLEGNTVTPENIGDYLHYNINFENTGNANAVNIVVKDLIDTTKFNINSLQLLYASHPVETKIAGNKVEFIFENINLPPSNINPIGGHGNVLFKIKTLENLSIGTEVSNTANIYFDYNAPINTNTARTTFAALKNTVFEKDSCVKVYPNPAKNSISIKAKNEIRSVELYDIQGRILKSIAVHKNEMTLDVSAQQNGVYFLKIMTLDGSSIEKIIKE